MRLGLARAGEKNSLDPLGRAKPEGTGRDQVRGGRGEIADPRENRAVRLRDVDGFAVVLGLEPVDDGVDVDGVTVFVRGFEAELRSVDRLVAHARGSAAEISTVDGLRAGRVEPSQVVELDRVRGCDFAAERARPHHLAFEDDSGRDLVAELIRGRDAAGRGVLGVDLVDRHRVARFRFVGRDRDHLGGDIPLDVVEHDGVNLMRVNVAALGPQGRPVERDAANDRGVVARGHPHADRGFRRSVRRGRRREVDGDRRRRRRSHARRYRRHPRRDVDRDDRRGVGGGRGAFAPHHRGDQGGHRQKVTREAQHGLSFQERWVEW